MNFLIHYATMEELNNTGIVGVFQTASNSVPILASLILSALFVILTFVSFFSTQRRTGYGDFWASCTVAGLITVIIAILFSFIPNFTVPLTESIRVSRELVTCVILEIFFTIMLFLSRER